MGLERLACPDQARPNIRTSVLVETGTFVTAFQEMEPGPTSVESSFWSFSPKILSSLLYFCNFLVLIFLFLLLLPTSSFQHCLQLWQLLNMKTAKSSSTGPPPHKRHRIKSSMLNKELPPLPPNPLISKLSATDLLQNRFREHLHDRSSQKSSELRYYHPTFQQQKKRELNQSQLYGKKYTPEAVALWNEQVLSHLVRGDASPAVYPIPDSPSSSLRVPNFTNNDICTSPALRSVMTASITTVSPNSLKSSSPCVSPVIPPPSPSPPQTFPTDTQPSPLPLYQLAATATTATTSAPGIVAQLAPPNLSDSSSSAQLRLLSTIQNQSKQTIQQPVASSPTSSSYSSSPSSSSSSVSSSTPSQSSQRQRSNSDAPVEAESSSVNQPQLAPDLFSQELEQQQKLKNDLKQKGVDSQVIDIKHKSIEAGMFLFYFIFRYTLFFCFFNAKKKNVHCFILEPTKNVHLLTFSIQTFTL